MGSNRYTQLSFSNMRDLALPTLPYEQLDQLLTSTQNKIDLTNTLAQKAPKYIQESAFATDAASQINQYQEGLKKQLADIAREGNVGKYLQALSEAQSSIVNLYKPGGLAYNLEKDFTTYQTHVAKEQERLAKGEITPEQFQMSVRKPIQDYDTAKGTKLFNPTLKPQAVNFDKFASDFVKNYHDSDLIRKGNFRVINGQMVYDDQKITGVEAQRVLKDLSQAYYNAASATGQLEDLYSVRNQSGAVTSSYRQSEMANAQSALELIEKTDLSNKESVKKLQQGLLELGLDIGKSGVDGIAGEKTKAAMKIAKESANALLTSLSTTPDSELASTAKQNYISKYISQLSTPYAQATARQKEERKFTNFGETMQRFKDKEDYKKKTEISNLVIRTLPSNKPVPKNQQYYLDGVKIKKNANASADARQEVIDEIVKQAASGQGTGTDFITIGALKLMNFFDRVFTTNDEVDIDSDPILSNVRDHLVAQNPQMQSWPNERVTEAVVEELKRQSEGSIDARYTAGSSKFKDEFDAIFTPILDTKGNLKNVGNLINFKFLTRDGVIIPGQKFAEEAIESGSTISYKGAVTDVASDIPYGSTVLAVGNDEIYMEPDIQTTYDPNTLINAGYRAINNAEIGNTVNFKYQGLDMQMTYKPDGSFRLMNKHNSTSQIVYPVTDKSGVLIGLTPNKQ